ncbi:LmbE family protein [Methylocella silvestris BL2]|uniref:LmbE family protein n=1 Tax=Methylocella silvestris (strain DSM 15510 / CIP 108128 / LMG 27833 / NCIMB 13906 / BL2) TaxID=395965 RepID=B8EIY8_METSB|nr:PIG-L family deacetylase [Methylocella silvestris]ACK52480.1 LmbE family protein [Methylocella silvestris BL2]
MRAKDFFEAAQGLPIAPLDHIVGPGGVIVVAPHPDDESLGCGGLIALAQAQGRAVVVIIVSDGCGSHPNSRSHPPERLRALRQEETREAATALGLESSSVLFLGLPDRSVPQDGAAAEEAADAIADVARNIDASAILATWAHDPHCDHQAAWRIAAMAHRRLQTDRALLAYPIWGWSLPPDAEVGAAPEGWRLAIDDVLALKQRAIAAHRSQVTDIVENDPPVLILPESALEPFKRTYEIFLRGSP